MKLKKITAAAMCVSLLLTGCSGLSGKRGLTYSDTLFDTTIKVQILDSANTSVIKGCETLCKKYDAMFSPDNKKGAVYKINHAKGKAVTVSDDTISLIKKGLYYGKFSKSEFDITIGSVSRLWDFRSGKKKVPSSAKIDKKLSHVNYHDVIINGNAVTLADKHAKIDLGGIAKGYIADRLKDYLVSQNVKSAIINLGGNVLCIGEKTDNSAFKIGIQKPFADRSETIAVMDIRDKSVVSSGIYERCFEQDGTLYHHLLNPKTGYPYDNGLIAVTIISDQSVDGDALSTTCFALGLEDGMKLAESLDDVQAFFVTSDYEIHYTRDFQKKIKVTETE